jgi:hypothetical protein
VFNTSKRGIRMNIQCVCLVIENVILAEIWHRVARQMISFHPFNTWPLRVKLFTEDAVKGWEYAAKVIGDAAPLPIGFVVATELEGVDGKSGQQGSGRKGPIEVTDGWLLSS